MQVQMLIYVMRWKYQRRSCAGVSYSMQLECYD